jgi:hypothetical protein
LTLSKGTARIRIHNYVHGATIPCKRVFIYLQYHVQYYNMCIEYEKEKYLFCAG